MMPQVSIIMPCYNAEHFISDAIESVILQTFSDWELLVVDDCSTDNSADIIRSFCEKDLRIKYFKTDSPSGSPAIPRNIGIENAKGRYIAFLDSDDLWFPTKLERQLPLFSMKDVAAVFSFYAKMNETGAYHSEKIESPTFVSYGYMLDGNCIGNLTGIYDSEKVGKVFQKQIHHEDYVMWLEILKNGFFAVNTNTVEAVYRENKHSLSGSKLQVFKWQWNILRNVLGMPLFKAAGHFSKYAVGGVLKFLK